MSDFSFIQEALLRHFTPEEVSKAVFTQRTRIALAALDFEFFCRYYLPQHFSQDPASFHRELFNDVDEMMEQKRAQNYLAVVFRGGAKTTIFNLALPLWSICLQKRSFIVIISDSERMAKEKATAIKFELETSERIREDFGDLTGKRWAETEFETASFIKVLALGSGMNIRGAKHYWSRPDLIILDDVENKDEVASPVQRQRLSSWFKQDVLAAGQPNTKIVVIGTYLAYDCVLKEMETEPVFWKRRNFPAIAHKEGGFAFAENGILWDEWEAIIRDLSNPEREIDARAFYEAHEEEMLVGAKPLWPERLPYYDLMIKRLAGRAAFNTEYLNEPSDPDSRFFRTYYTYKRMAIWNNEVGPWLVPWRKGTNEPSGIKPVRLSECILFAATDPSLGKSTQSDYSAIIIIALHPSGFRFVLESDLARRPPSAIIVAQNEWLKKYPQIARWTIETVQMQAFFKERSGIESLEETAGLPLVEYKTGSNNKHVRIQSLQAPLENGYLMLCEDGQELLKEQFEQYPHTSHDDGPDATEMAYNISFDYTLTPTVSITSGQTYRFGDMLRNDDYDPFGEVRKNQREPEEHIPLPFVF